MGARLTLDPLDLGSWETEVSFSDDMPASFRRINNSMADELRDIGKLMADSAEAEADLRIKGATAPGRWGRFFGLSGHPWESEGWIVFDGGQDPSLVLSGDGELYVGKLGADSRGVCALTVDDRTAWNITGYMEDARAGADPLEVENRLAGELAAACTLMRQLVEDGRIARPTPPYF